VNILYTVMEKPVWVKNQEALGNTVIHNAPRPLFGTATDDTWNLNGPRGRHFATINPDAENAVSMVDYNRRMDAVEVRYVTEQECIKIALDYVEEKYGTTEANQLAASPRSEDQRWLVNRGLDLMNGVK